MADNEQKARQLIAEAEKKLTSSKGFLGSLFGLVNQIFSLLTHLDVKIKFSTSQISLSLFLPIFFRICFSHFNYQVVDPTKSRMQSSVIIELPTCLKWPKSGKRQVELSAQLRTCTHKQAVDMTLLLTTLMPQTALKR